MQVLRLSSALGACLLLAGPVPGQSLPPHAISAQQAFLSVFAPPADAPPLAWSFAPAAAAPPRAAAAVRVASPVWPRTLAGWTDPWPGLPPEAAARHLAADIAGKIWSVNLGTLWIVPGGAAAPAFYIRADARLLRGFADSGAPAAGVPVHLVWLGADDLMPQAWGGGLEGGGLLGRRHFIATQYQAAAAEDLPALLAPDASERVLPRLAPLARLTVPGWRVAGPDARFGAWLVDVAPPEETPPVGPPEGLASRSSLTTSPLAVMAGLRARF